MSEHEQNNPEQLQAEIKALHESLHTIQLATLDKADEPYISYTPFVRIESNFYIFISQLATHTQNLLRNPKLSVLLIEDEATTKNMFARKRLNLKCHASEIKNESDNWSTILDAFEARQGNTVKLLRTLNDFHLFKLIPESGTFVKGFGQAFELSGEDLGTIQHISN
jgi:putative heme iron utilization protein